MENSVPTKTLRCFPNNNPWINPEIKVLLKEKKRAFLSGDKGEQGTVQRKLRKSGTVKPATKRRWTNSSKNNNVSGVSIRLKTNSGHKKPDSQAVGDQKIG